MKTTTLLKSLFLAIVLSITSSIYAQENTIPEVTTMDELYAALGENESVKVLFKNLEPSFVVKNLYIDVYMPDGTTLINSSDPVPSKADVIGTYKFVEDFNSFRFIFESVVNIYSFQNLEYLTNYYDLTKSEKALEEIDIIKPITVTAVDGANVFVQYQDLDRNYHSDLLVINGEHSLAIGDKIGSLGVRYQKSSSLPINDTTSVIVRNDFFSVDATSLGTITHGNNFKYTMIGSIADLKKYNTTAIQLPVGGTLTKENNKFIYTIGENSVELKSTIVSLEQYVGKTIEEAIKGVIDNCNTADQSYAFIVNEIKAIDTNYATIAEWIEAAQAGITTGSLKNPVNITLNTENSSKSYMFIQDETAAVCIKMKKDTIVINEEENTGIKREVPIVVYKSYRTVKNGDVITGISGNLILTKNDKIIGTVIEMNIDDTTNIAIVGTHNTKPIDVTIAELNADEKATKEGATSQYANRLVKLNGVMNGTNWINGNPKVFPLIQGEDTLKYSTNTLNNFPLNSMLKKNNTSQMTIVGVVDYMTINGSDLYSIYPRSVEDVHLVAPEFVPAEGIYKDGVEVEITMFGEAGVDYTAIYYTTDPNYDPILDPSMQEGILYENPLSLTETTTIWALATYLEDESKASPVVKAIYTIVDELPTATDKVQLVATVYTNNNTIFVNTEIGNNIEVYSVNGQTIFSGIATSTTTTIDANSNNIVLVRVNGKAVKVAIK